MASEQCQVKNDHKAPPALLCLCWKNFLPPPDSIFACWDIWEIQHKKMVAFAQALQFWVEKVNLPTGGKPCLLVGSMIELQEEMEWRTLPKVPSQHPCTRSYHGHDHGACCREEASKQVLWLGEGVTSLQTCSPCQADSPFVLGKGLITRVWGKGLV